MPNSPTAPWPKSPDGSQYRAFTLTMFPGKGSGGRWERVRLRDLDRDHLKWLLATIAVEIERRKTRAIEPAEE